MIKAVAERGDRLAAEWQRVGVYVVCRDDLDRILLTHLNVPGLPGHDAWTLPGGGMEWGEEPFETAARELDEETGLSAELGPVIGIWSDWLAAHETPRGKPGHAVGIVYVGRVIAGDLRTDFAAGSTDRAAWFGKDEVAALHRVPLVDFALDLLNDQSG
jgi:8-oxo-dGTP diphosphatase